MTAILSEFLGTLVLVALGTLAITQSGGDVLIISLAFAATLTGLIVVLGPLSGGHFNPAVTLGACIADRFPLRDVLPYWIAQIVGACTGSVLVLAVIGAGQPLGETTFSVVSPEVAFSTEALLTTLFVLTILFVTGRRELQPAAPWVIGALLFVLHLGVVTITGASLNPARSLGPAVVSGARPALEQIWLYLLAPSLGGAVAGGIAKWTHTPSR